MINMSYCMCRNTYLAFQEILDRLGDGYKLSDEEADCFSDLLKLALEYCSSYGIIDEIDYTVFDSVDKHASYFREENE